MSVSVPRRLWRSLSGYYIARRADLLHAMATAELGGNRAPLDDLLQKIGDDGDMQPVECLLLQTMETEESDG